MSSIFDALRRLEDEKGDPKAGRLGDDLFRPLPRRRRGGRWRLPAAAAAAVLILGGGGYYLWSGRNAGHGAADTAAVAPAGRTGGASPTTPPARLARNPAPAPKPENKVADAQRLAREDLLKKYAALRARAEKGGEGEGTPSGVPFPGRRAPAAAGAVPAPMPGDRPTAAAPAPAVIASTPRPPSSEAAPEPARAPAPSQTAPVPKAAPEPVKAPRAQATADVKAAAPAAAPEPVKVPATPGPAVAKTTAPKAAPAEAPASPAAPSPTPPPAAAAVPAPGVAPAAPVAVARIARPDGGSGLPPVHTRVVPPEADTVLHPPAAPAPAAKREPAAKPMIKKDFPMLKVTEVTYNARPENRSARIQVGDGPPRTVREGDEIQGVRVAEIKFGTVALQMGGADVDVDVGESVSLTVSEPDFH